MDSTQRFSDRVDDYVRYRPRYPATFIPELEKRIGLTPGWVVADIGSGTGFSAEPFLELGNEVFGVEPNAEMREAGERLLAAHPRFHSVAATAENTTLPAESVDLVTAAQAFHWFDRRRARAEFDRILKPGGWIALFWNRRDTEGSAFARDYEALLDRFGTDYQQIRHDKLTTEDIAGFLGFAPEHLLLDNTQMLDYDGLQGRLLSSSYTPAAGDARRAVMLEQLRELFEAHQHEGRVTMSHTTEIFLGRGKQDDRC